MRIKTALSILTANALLASTAMAANLEVSLKKTNDGSYRLELLKDPFLSNSRITDEKNTDHARLEALQDKLSQQGFFLKSIEDDIDTTTYVYGTDASKNVLNPNAPVYQFLQRWDSIVQKLGQYQQDQNFSLKDYDVTTDALRPAVLVSPLTGTLPELAFSDLFRGRFVGCFLNTLDGVSVPASLKLILDNQCSQERLVNVIESDLPKADFALSEESYNALGAQTGSSFKFRFGTFAEDLCQPATSALLDWQRLVPDYFAAGWVTRRDFTESKDFIAECRRYAMTKVVPQVSEAIKKQALLGPNANQLNPFARKFVSLLTQKTEQSSAAQSEIDQAFLSAGLDLIIRPDMTALASSFSRTADFSQTRLRPALVGFSGQKSDMVQVIDTYFVQRETAPASRTGFDKAYFGLTMAERVGARQQLARVLTARCPDTAPVDEKCIAASLSKAGKYSVVVKGFDGSEIARGFGFSTLMP